LNLGTLTAPRFLGAIVDTDIDAEKFFVSNFEKPGIRTKWPKQNTKGQGFHRNSKVPAVLGSNSIVVLGDVSVGRRLVGYRRVR
jgi:hypothetical protein